MNKTNPLNLDMRWHKRLSRAFFVFRMNNLWLWMDIKNRIRKIIYCSRGYHKIAPHALHVTQYGHDFPDNGKLLINIEWQECQCCGTAFYSRYKDKLKHQDYKRKERRIWRNIINRMVNNHGTKKIYAKKS